ncbi:MAG: reverse transcriptase/maturase family protein [Candidatus Paceibacterota bacterium]
MENNLFALHQELVDKIYQPAPYQAFFVYDPKKRHIHKAIVQDRILHQAIFRILYPIFDKHFIFDSYSSRSNKGTHKGVKRLFFALRKASKNWKQPVFVLKCDIRKFFDSIDHEILFGLIKKKILDLETLELVEKILKSFEKTPNVGIPLGNVTSQLFSNIYLNELDQFAKHKLKAKFYFRYADDFLIINKDQKLLLQNVFEIQNFLKNNLKLNLHPNKVSIRKLKNGIDFVGYVVLSNSVVLRTNTKKRILKKIKKTIKLFKEGKIEKEKLRAVIVSYFGVLKHCRSKKVKQQIKKML